MHLILLFLIAALKGQLIDPGWKIEKGSVDSVVSDGPVNTLIQWLCTGNVDFHTHV